MSIDQAELRRLWLADKEASTAWRVSWKCPDGMDFDTWQAAEQVTHDTWKAAFRAYADALRQVREKHTIRFGEGGEPFIQSVDERIRELEAIVDQRSAANAA